MSGSLWPHELQHARLPCPSLSHGACSNSCPLSWWCHPTISFSVVSFSSCPLSYPAFGVFSSESALCIRCPKYWSFSFSTSPSNEYSVLISFRMNGLISLQSKGLSRVFSSTTVQKLQIYNFVFINLTYYKFKVGQNYISYFAFAKISDVHYQSE